MRIVLLLSAKLKRPFGVGFLLFATCTLISPLVLAEQSAGWWQMKQDRADGYFDSGQYQEALQEYTEIASETASGWAQFRVAWIYSNGLGVEQNCQEAARWYTHAANSGVDTAANNLYVLYSTGCGDLQPDPELALTYLEQAAKQGDSRAQQNLARLYETGEGVKKNPYQAYDLAVRSANQSDITGIVLLARYSRDGIGVPVNSERALELYKLAASLDVNETERAAKQEAQTNIAQFYYVGNGVPRNLASAYEWALLASTGPSTELSKLAENLSREIEPNLSERERSEAMRSASFGGRVASEATDADLEQTLAQLIEEEKADEALILAQSLAKQENSYGEQILGQMYQFGYGTIEKDLDEAYVFFKRSCKRGNWYSCAYQAEVLVQQNRVADAKILLPNLESSAPDEDRAKMTRAQIYYQMKDLSRAEELVRQVLLGDPTNEDAKKLLALVAPNG